MKIMKYLVTMALLSPISSWALNLPEPSALLAKAQKSRIELREVLLDIDMNIPEMRDQPTFEKYFYTLDSLNTLSVKFNLDEVYPKMVSRLGLRMVGNGMRWLDVTKDSPEKLHYYVKWMDADVLNRFLDTTTYNLTLIKDRTRLSVMAKNIESILPLVDAKAENQTHLMSGYRRLLTDVAIVTLRDKTLPNAEVDFWIGKLMLPAAIAEYTDYLAQDIYQLNADNKSAANVYLGRLLGLSVQVGKLGSAAPQWLVNSLGDATTELFLRSVRLEIPFSANQYAQGLALLSGRQTIGFSQQWMAQEKMPRTTYVEQYLMLSNLIVARLKTLGLNRDADTFSKWLAQAAAPIMAQKVNLEGHYALVDEKGNPWFFTVAMAKDTMLIAALADGDGHVFKTFYNISFNVKDAGFVASEREPDTDGPQNPPAKFTIDDKGQIQLTDMFIRTGSGIFKGHKVQEFTDIWKNAKINAPLADGIYQGTIYLPSGTATENRLIITSFNGYTTGRLESDGIDIDLNIGTSGDDGAVILTSGRRQGASWYQIRAQITENGLNAYVIIGGKGQGTACTQLKKIR